ncbi:hypothetical protein PFICI_01684 [Pestalotiopsis fici W106-1]|uniref:Major facilitator superfamily (MFS) profile domain-containing protein n=1 Tax=Pestalotiopsis fici (strain W106-1 / CGMCC3.15140) TaxID=1229662 RepID=W3XRL2_PESFW|nr:uncharacterized protein PFICI_01684 [Pestalotiopsis fici W106-1]ETS87856.1 hypothetical protein PFICI_01684 [Pestalotiopsis fici W106-1]
MSLSSPRYDPSLGLGAETTRAMGKTRQYAFLLLVALTQAVQMVPLGVGINSGLVIGQVLGADPIRSVWVVASYPLTQGSFVLIGGRLGAIYGHKNLVVLGGAWWVFWALCGGFSSNLVMMCTTRALCGAGGGIMVPNLIALISITLPPGQRRNLGFALFGAMSPVGAAGGSLVGAVIVQLSEFRWVFFLMGLLGFVVYGSMILVLANDEPVDASGSVDWVGAYLGVGGLILFNFVWNQAPSVGWQTWYEIVLLIASLIHFTAFTYWEMRVAKHPILPFDIWRSQSFNRLLLTISFAFMGLGIFFWYMNLYMQTVNGDSLITVGLHYLPLTIGGSITPFFAAWLVPRLPAKAIIGIGCLAMATINILLATIPAHLTYWAMAFPAMLLSAFTVDLITTSSQIIASNAVPLKHQGVAGSLIGTFLSYGQSTGLGFAGIVEVQTFNNGRDLLKGYHNAAYLAVGFSVAALLLSVFINVSEDDDDVQMEQN